MRKFAIALIFMILNIALIAQSLNYDQLTQLNVESTDKAVVLPRLTTSQMDSIPALLEDGLLIYNVTEGKHYEYSFINGWQPISPLIPNDGLWQMPIGQRLGIARFPDFPLDVAGSARVLGNIIIGQDNNTIQGAIRYNTAISDFEGFTSSGWTSLTSIATPLWSDNPNGIHYTDGFVGVGTSTPNADLHIQSSGALANLFVTSPVGANIRTFAHTASAGVVTTTNTPLTLGANNVSAMEINPNRSVDFFGDLNVDMDHSLQFGFNVIEENSLDGSLSIFGDGINLNTCSGGNGINIEADCESSLRLFGSLDSYLGGHFGTTIESLSGSTQIKAENGPVQFFTEDVLAGVINGSQDWGIKTSNARADLHIAQDESNTNRGGLLLENDGNGNDYWNFRVGVNDLVVYYDADGSGNNSALTAISQVDEVSGVWSPFSDRRLKKNINKLGNVLEDVMKLKPSKYQYKHVQDQTDFSIGFLAQEVQEYFPELVSADGEYLSLSYMEMTAVAIKAIQEQQEIIEQQAKQIKELAKLNTSIIQRLEKLED